MCNGLHPTPLYGDVPAAKNEEDKHAHDGQLWYLPHHGVYHPQKPGKMRVVFDCSANYHGESLNRHLLSGPDLANNLLGVLCRFRQESTAFMCDIEKIFYQVFVKPKHRNFFRFMWWEGGNIESKPIEYRMAVHLFGAASSPGCANLALKKTADDFEKVFGSEAAEFVWNDFYVDDGLKSVPTPTEAIELIRNTKALCKGGFHLHKLVSNEKAVLDTVPTNERATGIQNLNLEQDSLPIESPGCLSSGASNLTHFNSEQT